MLHGKKVARLLWVVTMACSGALAKSNNDASTGDALDGGMLVNDGDVNEASRGPSGLPNPAFGTNGVVTTDLSHNLDTLYAMTVAPDGKVLVAGISEPNGNDSLATVVRYNRQGTMDSSFANAGVFQESTVSSADGVAVQSTGTIIVTGTYTSPADGGFPTTGFVKRLTSAGTVDTSFADQGAVEFLINEKIFDAFLRVAKDDSIYVYGQFLAKDGTYDLFLGHYTAAGSLDPAFGQNGFVTMDLDGFDAVFGLGLCSDGSMIFGGVGGRDTRVAILMRLGATGAVDSSFGAGGRVSTPLMSNRPEALALDAMERIYVVGGGDFGEVSRFTKDGAPDVTFGSNGLVTTPLGFNGTASFTAVLADPNGGVYVGGVDSATSFLTSQISSRWVLARFSESGALIPAFGTNGLSLSENYNPISQPNALAFETDHTIIAAGGMQTIGGTYDFGLINYFP